MIDALDGHLLLFSPKNGRQGGSRGWAKIGEFGSKMSISQI